jgi:uncharacterized protein (TIGR02246 family)
MLSAQSKPDDSAIKKILQDEEIAWNAGDAESYSRHFAADGTFTNVLGMYYTGHDVFVERHATIFKSVFRGTTLRQDLVSVKFVRADVAIVETLGRVSGFSASGPPPGTHTDAEGRLSTRLLQVMVRDSGEWRIVSYHNVDVKPGLAESPMK